MLDNSTKLISSSIKTKDATEIKIKLSFIGSLYQGFFILGINLIQSLVLELTLLCPLKN